MIQLHLFWWNLKQKWQLFGLMSNLVAEDLFRVSKVMLEQICPAFGWKSFFLLWVCLNFDSLMEQPSSFDIYFRFRWAYCLIHWVIIKLFLLWYAHSKYLIYLVLDFTCSCNFSTLYWLIAWKVLAAVIIDRLSFVPLSLNKWYLKWSTMTWFLKYSTF